jgi:His-Xaa-Ser system protein HxsD
MDSMKNIFTKIEDGKVLVSLPVELYEKAAIMSAAHEMTDSFAVLVEPLDNKNIGVYFQPKTGIQIDENILNTAALDFCNKVLDQQLRLDIEKRYGNIRDMIVKQAFTPVSFSDLSKEMGNKSETQK